MLIYPSEVYFFTFFSLQALLKEAKEQKPLVDQLNEVSSSLLDLIPWHTREGLDRMVTEDNERYRAFCEAAAQQVEQMDADMLKSQQVNYKSAFTTFYLYSNVFTNDLSLISFLLC